MPIPARERFLELLHAAVDGGALVKLTLGRHRGADATLRNLSARPVVLQAGPRLSLVWRHATRDLTKNFPPAEALALLEPLVGGDFLDAHLFTAAQTAQLICQPDGTARLRIKAAAPPTLAAAPPPRPPATAHDQPKAYPVSADAAWLQALGVTNTHGQPRAGMAGNTDKKAR